MLVPDTGGETLRCIGFDFYLIPVWSTRRWFPALGATARPRLDRGVGVSALRTITAVPLAPVAPTSLPRAWRMEVGMRSLNRASHSRSAFPRLPRQSMAKRRGAAEGCSAMCASIDATGGFFSWDPRSPSAPWWTTTAPATRCPGARPPSPPAVPTAVASSAGRGTGSRSTGTCP